MKTNCFLLLLFFSITVIMTEVYGGYVDKQTKQNSRADQEENDRRIFREQQPARNTRRWSRRNNKFNYKLSSEDSTKNVLENGKTEVGSFVNSRGEQFAYRPEVNRRKLQKNDRACANGLCEKENDAVGSSGKLNNQQIRLRKNSRRLKALKDHINDVRLGRSVKWEGVPDNSVDKRLGRDYNKEDNGDISYEDLDVDTNANSEESRNKRQPEDYRDENNGNSYPKYYKPERHENQASEISKKPRFLTPVKKFFKRKIPALCRLYTHHERGVESILSSFLNLGSRPIHSAIMKYCNKKTEEAESEAVPNEEEKSKSTIGKLFGWLSKKLGMSSSKKKEHNIVNATELPRADKDESMVIQPKVVNLIISPKAALTVHNGIEDKMELESHVEHLEHLEEEVADREHLHEETLSHDWKDHVLDNNEHHVDLEETIDNELDEKLRERIEENFKETLDEEIQEEKLKETIDENNDDRLTDDKEQDDLAQVVNDLDDQAIKAEIWDGVEETLKNAYKYDNEKLKGHHSDRALKQVRNSRKMRRDVQQLCEGKNCDKILIRKAMERVASEDLDSLKDLDELAELISSLKYDPKNSYQNTNQKPKTKKDAMDSSDEDKYFNFIEKFLTPQVKDDESENEPKDLNDIAAVEDFELKPNHHHHPSGTKSAWPQTIADFIQRHETLFIILAALLCIPILCLLLFFCFKNGCSIMWVLIIGAAGFASKGLSKGFELGKKVAKCCSESEEEDGKLQATLTVSASESDFDDQETQNKVRRASPLTRKAVPKSSSDSFERGRSRSRPGKSETRSGKSSRPSNNKARKIEEENSTSGSS